MKVFLTISFCTIFLITDFSCVSEWVCFAVSLFRDLRVQIHDKLTVYSFLHNKWELKTVIIWIPDILVSRIQIVELLNGGTFFCGLIFYLVPSIFIKIIKNTPYCTLYELINQCECASCSCSYIFLTRYSIYRVFKSFSFFLMFSHW